MQRKIIAIVGLPGSGKSEVIKYLMDKFSWPRVYFGEVTFAELAKRGLAINERNERMIREELRGNYGRLHYASQVIKKINAIKNNKNILVESLYDWAEYKLFKEKFDKDFITIAVYASPPTRYQRLAIRPERPLSLAEAQSRDYAQIENIFQAGPIAMADYTIVNENTFAELYQKVDYIIKKLE